MYHVVSTSLSILFIYLISYLFYKIGYYSLQLHRKFWNIILAFAFFLAGIAGVFLALQINYKWNIPFIKEILRWHVEFGIGLATTGILHFIWHLNYYGKLFAGPIVVQTDQTYRNRSFSGIKINLFIIGFVSCSVQFIMMREIMNITGGYELIAGSFLASWLIGSALGSYLAGTSQLNDIRKINLIFSLSPLISLTLMLFFARVFMSPGESPSFLMSIIYTLFVLIPFCMVSGFSFIKIVTSAGSSESHAIGKLYSIETAGGILSGITISLLTAGFVGTYKLLLLILLFMVTYVVITYYTVNVRSKYVAILIALIFSCTILFLNPDIVFRQLLLPVIKITATQDTPYGNITLGSYKGEASLYYNQRLLAYNYDVTEREEDIHYAMLQCARPDRVILISGSLQSHIKEILKYPVNSITYIERDPILVQYETPDIKNSKTVISIRNEDAFRYIRNTKESADVIILLVPPPSTLLLNRYYTTEFFKDVKKRLSSGGIFMCSTGPGDNYLNRQSINLSSSVYNSLAANFVNVKPVVGNKLYFIASDNPVSLSFCSLADEKNIKNVYVSHDYLDDERVTKKSEEVMALIDRGLKQNRSAFPGAAFHSQMYQFSKNLDEKIPAILLLLIIFALPVVTIKRASLLMYSSASALAGFEIIILLMLQIMVGNMYQLTGLIIAGLMTGLALGSGFNIWLLNTISVRTKVISLILFYIIFGLLFNYMIELKSSLTAVIVTILSGFLPAVITGSIFRDLTGKNREVLTISGIYSADLAGSAFGFIFISGLAIPVFGIQVSVYLLAMFILGGILFGTVKNYS